MNSERALAILGSDKSGFCVGHNKKGIDPIEVSKDFITERLYYYLKNKIVLDKTDIMWDYRFGI